MLLHADPPQEERDHAPHHDQPQQARGEQRRHLDRLAERRESAQRRLAEFSLSDRRELLDRIETLLKKINYHRSAEAQLNLNTLYLPLLSVLVSIEQILSIF